MRSFARIVALAFLAGAHAGQEDDIDMETLTKMLQSDEVMDQIVNKLVDKLLGAPMLANVAQAPMMRLAPNMVQSRQMVTAPNPEFLNGQMGAAPPLVEVAIPGVSNPPLVKAGPKPVDTMGEALKAVEGKKPSGAVEGLKQKDADGRSNGQVAEGTSNGRATNPYGVAFPEIKGRPTGFTDPIPAVGSGYKSPGDKREIESKGYARAGREGIRTPPKGFAKTDGSSIPAVALICLFIGSGILFAALQLRRKAPIEDPLMYAAL